jgi:hypothetical protein
MPPGLPGSEFGFKAMMDMRKIDVGAIEAARHG